MSDLEYIADYYGFDNQAYQTIEEMSELTKELCKWKRFHNNKDAVIEELADVQLMLWQLQYLIGCENKVLEIIEEKEKRQMQRINDYK